VVIGADEPGCKKLPARTGGLRESTQNRRELRRDLKRRDLKRRDLKRRNLKRRDRKRRDPKRCGLKQDPKPAAGDGASGFWSALREGFATSQEHHCRGHKTVNVLSAMPKSVQAKAKGHLHDIRQARTKATANAALNIVAEICGVTGIKAVAKPVKDRGALPTFV